MSNSSSFEYGSSEETVKDLIKPEGQERARESAADVLFGEAEEFKRSQQQAVEQKADGLLEMFDDGDLAGDKEAASELKRNAEAMKSVVSSVSHDADTVLRASQEPAPMQAERLPPKVPERTRGTAKETMRERRETEIKELDRNYEKFQEIADRVTDAKWNAINKEFEAVKADPGLDQETRAYRLESLKASADALRKSAREEEAFREAERRDAVIPERSVPKETANEIRIIRCPTEDGGQVEAIYKAAKDENASVAKIHGIPAETSASREWLAGMIDRALFDEPTVPTTILYRGSEGVGSAQVRIEGGRHVKTMDDLLSGPPDLDKIAILDTVIQSADRHRNNLMVDANGRLKAIDNGTVFGARDGAAFEKSCLDRGVDPQAVIDLMKRDPNFRAVDHYPLQSYPRAVLSAERGGAVAVAPEIKRQLDRFLGDAGMQAAVREAFGLALGTEAETQHALFIASLKSVSDGGMAAYEYPNAARQEVIRKKIAEMREDEPDKTEGIGPIGQAEIDAALANVSKGKDSF